MQILRALGLVLAPCLFLISSAFGSSPQIKTQAPGYYRLMVGDYEVTVLLDGFFPIKPKEMLQAIPAAKLRALLDRSHQGELIPTSVNAFLVNTGSRLILIDAGCGGFFGPSFGRVAENLKAAGYSPDQVDEIEITHMHADHLGGVFKEGKAMFPHATLRVDQHDADFWLKAENAKGTKPPLSDMFKWAVESVAPYQAASQFKPFSGKTELAPGVTAIPAYGHTPGHTVYAIESKGQKLLLVGDLFHVEAVQFPEPGISMAFDSSLVESSTQRKRIFKEAAKDGYLLGAAHLPFPGIGHVLSEKTGFRYLPIPYAPMP